MESRSADNDLGYFDIYGPAPMFEAMTRLSPSPIINSTTTNYGPFLYGLTRLINATNCLEIGLATGWSSGFLAWAIKENNICNNRDGFYCGMDIADKPHLMNGTTNFNLPARFITDPCGSVRWLRDQTIFEPESLDLIFDDGWHNTEYVQQEVEFLYPLLKKNGILVLHDVYAACEEVYPIIRDDPRYKWEALRIFPCYGLGLLRKMDGDKKIEPGHMTAVSPEETMRSAMSSLNPHPIIDADYGPFLYLLARAIGAIGVVRTLYMGDDPWEMAFLDHAVKETNARYGEWSWLKTNVGQHEQINLACLKNKDLIGEVYGNKPFGLQDKGYGFMVVKDISQEDQVEVAKTYGMEHIRLDNCVLFRKMDNYDYEQKQWPEGDEQEKAHIQE